MSLRIVTVAYDLENINEYYHENIMDRNDVQMGVMETEQSNGHNLWCKVWQAFGDKNRDLLIYQFNNIRNEYLNIWN